MKVSWDDDIPKIWKNKTTNHQNVPNHQPAFHSISHAKKICDVQEHLRSVHYILVYHTKTYTFSKPMDSIVETSPYLNPHSHVWWFTC